MWLINADDLLDEVEKSMHNNIHADPILNIQHKNEHRSFQNMIFKMPHVDANPMVYGKWYLDSEDDVHCDQCDWSFSMSPCCTIDEFGMKYCPNCGAKMSYERIIHGQSN